MPLYYLKDKIIKQTTFILKRLPFWFSFIALFLMIYDLGFNTLNDYHYHLNVFYNICLSIGMLAIVRR
ncbi:hypothetical protein BK387_28265 [Escherichia coli]|nr:hypothetical protein BK387_28265 [Escherichia coli]